jgi:hypothetical protein
VDRIPRGFEAFILSGIFTPIKELQRRNRLSNPKIPSSVMAIFDAPLIMPVLGAPDL